MDFPAWELLTELSNKGNIAAQFFLEYFDTIFVENDGSVSSGASDDHIFDNKSIIDKLNMLVGGGEFESDKPAQIWSYWTNRDLRVKNLIISGYRGIPYKKEAVKYFGLSFTGRTKNDFFEKLNDDKPSSCIILGSNGSGKTTLYSAMELLLLNKTAIETKHKIASEDNKVKFRHYLGNKNNPVYISVSHVDPEVAPQYTSGNHPLSEHDLSIKDNINLSPFFCSESDLSIFECSGTEINTYLDNTIGLGEINTIIKKVESLINETETRINQIYKSKEGGKDSLTEDEKAEIGRYGEIFSFLRQIHDRAITRNEKIKGDLLSQAQSIITSLLKDYEDEMVEISFSQKDNNKFFNGLLQLKSDNTQINPRYYFNNFRFKLYLVSLKVAIAFYIMNSRKISFPLIFDDIFDSSDFSNRVNSKEYFNKIFRVYQDLNILEGKPLQIIFFTQDEIIAESIFDGICDIRKENEGVSQECYPERKAMLVRLFTPEESGINDKFQVNEAKGDSEPKEFYNLYDIIRTSSLFHT